MADKFLKSGVSEPSYRGLVIEDFSGKQNTGSFTQASPFTISPPAGYRVVITALWNDNSSFASQFYIETPSTTLISEKALVGYSSGGKDSALIFFIGNYIQNSTYAWDNEELVGGMPYLLAPNVDEAITMYSTSTAVSAFVAYGFIKG